MKAFLRSYVVPITLSLLVAHLVFIQTVEPFDVQLPVVVTRDGPVSFLVPFSFPVSALLGLLLALPTLIKVYQFFFVPLEDYQCTAGKIQFGEVHKHLNAFEGAQLLYKSRRLGNFPPPYPNGWWVLAHSNDVKKGEVKPMNVLGGQYVLWRGQDGKAHLFDAYCPHLGANLAFGGEVHGNCIKCPFHGWEYNGDGSCAAIPYADQPNPHAKAEVFTILEQNQIIYFWYDAEKREPWWTPPFFPEIDNGKLTYHGRTEHHVLAHIQELPENGADVPHLSAVHPQSHFGVTHKWDATWKVLNSEENVDRKAFLTKENGINGSTTTFNEDLSHWTEINLNERKFLFGFPLRFLDVTVRINQVGPGIVWLRFNTPFGQALVLGAPTPFGPMVQRAYHMIFSSRTVPRWLAKIMVQTLGLFYEQDVMIWQWKTFPAKPAFVKEDASIRRYRKWFSQFYSEHSIPFDEAVSTYAKGSAALPQDW